MNEPSIEAVAVKACLLAETISCYVVFKYEGVDCLVHPNDSVRMVVAHYEHEQANIQRTQSESHS